MNEDFEQYIMKHTSEEKVAIPLSTKQALNKALLKLEKPASTNTLFKVKKRALILVVVGVAALSNVLLATDLPSQIIEGISGFFAQSNFTKYKGDSYKLQELEQYVGLNIEKDGVKVQIDSVALDDNFLNVFYTLESETVIPKQDEQGDVAWLYAPNMELKIDGQPWEYMGNGQDTDAYLEDEHTLKVMERINVAHLQLPESFSLEVKLIKPCGKDGDWTMDVPVQKLDAVTQTVVVDQPYKIETNSYSSNHEGKTTFDLNIDKVIFSPLASQIVISEKNIQGEEPFNEFALFDQDGNSLDVITQWVATTGKILDNESTNGFEFIPTENLRKIVIVPITKYDMEEEIKDGITYGEQYREYEKRYPIQLEIPIANLPVKIHRGPLIKYEILDLKLQEDNMVLRFKVNGVPMDQLMKTEIYPLDKNKDWLVYTGIKSLSIDREKGIYTLRWTNGKKDNEVVDFTKAEYLTLDDGGYLLPEQLLWDQAIEIDVAEK